MKRKFIQKGIRYDGYLVSEYDLANESILNKKWIYYQLSLDNTPKWTEALPKEVNLTVHGN